MKTSDIFREVCKRMPENTSGITIMWTPDEYYKTELDSWDFGIMTELNITFVLMADLIPLQFIE